MGSVQAKATCKVRASVSFVVCAPCFLPSQTYILLYIKTFIHAYYVFWSNLARCCHLQIVPQDPQLYFPPKFLGYFLFKPTRPPWCFLHAHGSKTICYSMATTEVSRGTHPEENIKGWQLFSWGWSCPGSSPSTLGFCLAWSWVRLAPSLKVTLRQRPCHVWKILFHYKYPLPLAL